MKKTLAKSLGAAAVASALTFTSPAQATAALTYEVKGIMNTEIDMPMGKKVNANDAYTFSYTEGVSALFTSGDYSISWDAAGLSTSAGGTYFNFNAIDSVTGSTGAGVYLFGTGFNSITDVGSVPFSTTDSLLYLDNNTTPKEVYGTVISVSVINPEVAAVPEPSTLAFGALCVLPLGMSAARRVRNYFKKDSVNVA